VTRIKGNEPGHWHDGNGRHAMTDPRAVYGDKWKVATGDYTDTDERAYVRHLMDHEGRDEAGNVIPLPGDSDTIALLFDMINNALATANKSAELIVTLRRKQAQEPGQQ
jgi:hypothetical protein